MKAQLAGCGQIILISSLNCLQMTKGIDNAQQVGSEHGKNLIYDRGRDTAIERLGDSASDAAKPNAALNRRT